MTLKPLMFDIEKPVSDTDFIINAIVNHDAPFIKKSKLDYDCYAEFLIHRHLNELRREFNGYDIRNVVVLEWAFKRIENMQIKINQIRLRYFYFKPIKY